MTKHTTQDKRIHNQRHWQAHVKALGKSGLNRTEYCRQHNLSYHAMAYWHRKLSSQNNNSTTLVPVSLPSNFPDRIVKARQAELKIILPGEVTIAVGDSFMPTTLTRLLATLEKR